MEEVVPADLKDHVSAEQLALAYWLVSRADAEAARAAMPRMQALAERYDDDPWVVGMLAAVLAARAHWAEDLDEVAALTDQILQLAREHPANPAALASRALVRALATFSGELSPTAMEKLERQVTEDWEAIVDLGKVEAVDAWRSDATYALILVLRHQCLGGNGEAAASIERLHRMRKLALQFDQTGVLTEKTLEATLDVARSASLDRTARLSLSRTAEEMAARFPGNALAAALLAEIGAAVQSNADAGAPTTVRTNHL
jgi:hypothetical protein